MDIGITAELGAEVGIEIADRAPDDLFTRAETAEFQRSLYGDRVRDRATVLEHWAYNAIFNGVTDASRLDGWADLDPGLVIFTVSDRWMDRATED